MRWAYHQETKIKILGLPKTCWTQNVWQTLSKFGTVVRIEVELKFPNNNAWVTFQSVAFYFLTGSSLTLMSRNPLQKDIPQQLRVGNVLVNWDEIQPHVRTLPSPVDPTKHYYENNTLIANSIEFGTTDAKMSMISMHMAQARGQVRLKLDLKRKELGIQFPQQIGMEMREYRFELPIALLSNIYKDINCAQGQTAIIIPFESPPRFFVRKHEGEVLMNGNEHTSFSANEKIWNDWNTWFRETDVVETGLKRSQQEMPLMNHKDKTVIDIGKSFIQYAGIFVNNFRPLDHLQAFPRQRCVHQTTIHRVCGRPYRPWGRDQRLLQLYHQE
jgi:RNA-dependent RNA polymerase